MTDIPIGGELLLRYVPRDQCEAYERDGWRYVHGKAQPMPGNHGRFACLMQKEAEP